MAVAMVAPPQAGQPTDTLEKGAEKGTMMPARKFEARSFGC